MKRSARGLSLVELMVALAIGSILIAGAVYVYSQSRTTQRVSDVVARMQENGRFVLSIIEPDVQLAGYYGFTNSADNIQYILGGSLSSPRPAATLKTVSDDVEGVGATNDCGNNFAVNVLATVEGTNSAYFTGGAQCAPRDGGWRAGTDTLTIRRTSGPPDDGIGSATANRLQMMVSRLSPTNQFLFADGQLPATTALAKDIVQVRDMIVNTYYIANNSDPNAVGLPSLRVKTLTEDPAGPRFIDQEVMSGVEDLQVQFGIDTGDYDGDGNIDAGLDEDGNGIPDAANGIATRYVNANEVPAGFQVVSVRLWVMVRADQPEVGFYDPGPYTYADRTDIRPNDNFRRRLFSRTIQLRNARTL